MGSILTALLSAAWEVAMALPSLIEYGAGVCGSVGT